MNVVPATTAVELEATFIAFIFIGNVPKSQACPAERALSEPAGMGRETP
jgi:DNA-binding FadR family transcriptional regulator